MFNSYTIGNKKIFNYTQITVDSKYHPRLILKREVVEYIKSLRIIFQPLEGEERRVEIKKDFLDALGYFSSKGFIKIERIILKNLKINKIWSSCLWEEKKEVKMEQAQ